MKGMHFRVTQYCCLPALNTRRKALHAKWHTDCILEASMPGIKGGKSCHHFLAVLMETPCKLVHGDDKGDNCIMCKTEAEHARSAHHLSKSY